MVERMGWVRTVLQEIFGLLVDDESLAAAAVLWVALVWAAWHWAHLPFPGGIALGLGFLCILAENAARFARRSVRKRVV